MNKRFHYVITARNSNRVDEGSPYIVASAQIRARDMNHALEVAMQAEGITRERNPMWNMRVVFDLYRQGKRVGVYITPVADDMESD